MADVLLELDDPQVQLRIGSCSSLSELKSAVRRSDNINLDEYCLQERYKSTALTDQDLARRRGVVSVEGKLQTSFTCPRCAQKCASKVELAAHCSTCQKGGNLFATDDLASIRSLLCAL